VLKRNERRQEYQSLAAIASRRSSFATSFYPATLMVLNVAVAIMLVMRRRAIA